MNNLEQAIESIISNRRLTRKDQHLLMSVFARKDLSPTDAALINRIHEALSQGRLRIVD